MTQDDQRLTRIEVKLDKLADAVVSLARMEERMITLFNRMDSYEASASRQGERIGALEKKVHSSAWVERVVWVIVAAGVAAVIKLGGS
jgi:hypothetical protein